MYKLLAIAGTFDHLHKGHQYFISQAFKLGEKVIIGLTSDEFARKKLSVVSCQLSVEAESGKDTSDGSKKAHNHLGSGRLKRSGSHDSPEVKDRRTPPMVEESVKPKIQNYQEREKELMNFLEGEELLDRSEIVKIDDVYGPAAEENEIEALVVTSETMKRARLVNKRRRLKRLKKLKILRIPLIDAEDHRKIASTRIRLGEIDRFGKVFLVQILSDRKKFTPISEDLRHELKKPQGVLIKGNPENHQLIVPKLGNIIRKLNPVMISTIGDEVTRLCNQVGIKPNLAIIDFKVSRKKVYHSLFDLGFPRTEKNKNLPNSTAVKSDKNIFSAVNPAGYITKTLIEAVRKAFRNSIKSGHQQIIRVIGEEDLAGVPAILLSPLGSVVIYGQPGEGIVLIEITEEKKKKMVELIKT